MVLRTPVLASCLIFCFTASPAAAAGRVVVGETRIEVRETIPFAPGSATIPPTSGGLLDEIARALRENPRFTKVRIEGHTDSSGDETQNRALSQARADEVRRALIERGVSEERLTAQGFGSADPVASNAESGGRTLNRRVVLEVMAVGGTAVQRPPLAKVSSRRNEVAARAPLTESWTPAHVGLGLRRSWRVQTETASGAGITFRDASKIEMREETLVVIYGATKQRSKTTSHRAELTTGALRTFLRNLSADNEELVVESGAGDAVLTDGQALVTVNAEGRVGTVSNFAGEAVALHGKTQEGARAGTSVAIQKGYGSRVQTGKAPEPPRPLPPAPAWSAGAGLSAFVVGDQATDVELAWASVDQATGYRVALRDLADPTRAPYEAQTQKARATLPRLTRGEYEARVSSVDDIGLQSVPSAPLRVQVVALTTDGPSSRRDPRALALGDRLMLPPAVTCKMGDSQFQGGTWVVPGPAGAPVFCRVGDAPPTRVAVAVEGFVGAVRPTALPFNEPTALTLSVSPPVDTQTDLSVDVEGAPFLGLSPEATVDDQQRYTLRLGPLNPDATEATLRVMRRGVPILMHRIPRVVDETPPRIGAPQLRAQGDQLAIDVAVTDEAAGVEQVTAQWGPDGPSVMLVYNAQTHTFQGLASRTSGLPKTLTLVATDRANNASAPASVPVDPALFGPDLTLALYAVPVAVAVVPTAAAIALLLDGGLFLALGRPPLMGFAADLTGQAPPSSSLVVFDVVGAAMATALALVVVAGGSAAVYSYTQTDSE